MGKTYASGQIPESWAPFARTAAEQERLRRERDAARWQEVSDRRYDELVKWFGGRKEQER